MSELHADVAPAPVVEGAGALLALVRERGPSTTSELAALTGLSRSTVTQRLERLVEARLVLTGAARASADTTTGPATRGRPASVTRFDPHAGMVLAAQLGLTGSRLALTDLAGEIEAERFITMDVPAGPEQLITDVGACFDELLAASGRDRAELAGVGVGLPSAVELGTYARSRGGPGVTWDRGRVERALRDRYAAPVFCDLDVNLLALAERRLGWPDLEVFVCVKLGTLINAAIVVNGRPVLGTDRLAGELGHLKVDGSTAPCACGGIGCLDAVASGHALVAQLAALGFDVDHVSDVVALADDRVPEAVRAVRDAGRRVGEVLASVTNLLNPGAVVVWGYLTEAETPLFAGLREGLYQAALPGSSEHLELSRTALGDLAGVRGAALRVVDEVLAPDAVDRLLVSGSWSAAHSGRRSD